MSDWTADELAALTKVDELHIAGRKSDGSLRKPVVIWMVTLDGALYVRSVNGADASWFRGTQATGTGHVRAGAVDRDVAFTRVSDVTFTRVSDAAFTRVSDVDDANNVTDADEANDVTDVNEANNVDNANNLDDELDAAYRAKYPRWSSAVDSINSAAARSTTLRVDPT